MSYLETRARTYVNKYNISRAKTCNKKEYIKEINKIKRLLIVLNKIPCSNRKKRRLLINRLLYKSKIIKEYCNCVVKHCKKELLNLINSNIRWSYHILKILKKRKIKKSIINYQKKFIKKTINPPLSKWSKKKLENMVFKFLFIPINGMNDLE